MSKSEDYLDDLLNSVSDINKRNNKKDIESLLKSMDEPKEQPKERERKRTPRRRDYGERFVREFEQEIVNGAADDFVRDFELELDAEAADIIESAGDTESEDQAVSAPEEANAALHEEGMQEPDVSHMLGEIRRKMGGEENADDADSADNLMVDTMEMPEPSDASEEEPLLMDEDNPTQDLMDIISLSEDGDLADIGSMLQADESGELDMAQLLGGEESDDEATDSEEPRDEFERLGSIEELKDLAEAKKKKGKKGFFARLSAFLFGEDEPEQVKVPEEESLGSLSDENAEILKELDSTEKSKKKKKPKKEKKKKEEKPKKPPKPKKEKKPKEKDNTPPLPKKPVILIGIMAASIFLLIMLGSSNLQYSSDIQTAKDSLQRKDYVEAYNLIAGSKIRAKDESTYYKALILSSVQAEYQSYYNLKSLGQYDMALDALIRGYGRCIDQADEAQTYDVAEELDELQQQITDVLQNEMGVSAEEAASLYELNDRQEYTRGIHQILQNLGLE
ncbi:MAG: hypothetical protein ACI4DO_09710 [Roseburia sp.]